MTSFMFIPLLFKHTFSLRPSVLGLIPGQKFGAGYENRNYTTDEERDSKRCHQLLKKPPRKTKTATHVIFDLDGTVLNTEDIEYDAASAYVNKIFEKKLELNVYASTMGSLPHEGASAIVKELNLPIKPDVYNHGVWQALRGGLLKAKQLRGVDELTEHFACYKIPMALASSSTQETFDLKSRNHKTLFKRFCPIVLGGSEKRITRGKPHPDIFYLATTRFGKPPVHPEQVVVFEDSLNGVLAAKAAGMQTVMIPAPWLPKHMIELADPEVVIKNLEQFDPTIFDLPELPKPK